jgi:WD40 repeat protein
VPKEGSNARKRTARQLAQTEHIPYTEARRRIDQRAPSITAPAPLRTSDAALIGHTAPVYGVVFHPTGRFLASAAADSTAQLWDPASRQAIAVLTGESPMLSLALSHSLRPGCLPDPFYVAGSKIRVFVVRGRKRAA